MLDFFHKLRRKAMKIKTAIFVSIVLAVSMLSFGAANLRFMTGLEISPTSPVAGDTVTCTVTWKAQNDAAVNARIIGGIDGTTIYDTTFPNVPMGETRTISFTWTATAGGHNAWFHMDPDNLTGDPYPSNNYIEQSFTVGSGGTGHPSYTITSTFTATIVEPGKLNPDLICSINNSKSIDLAISKFEISNHPTNKYMKTLHITFKNNGQKCVPSFRFNVVDSFGQIIKNFEVNPAVGKTYALYGNSERLYSLGIHTNNFNDQFETCKAKVTIPGSSINTPTVTKIATVKCSKIRVLVDPLHAIAESNEVNNRSEIKTVLWKEGVAP